MTENLTLAMLKPEAMQHQQTGKIISAIEAAGFHLHAMRLVRLTPAAASRFYHVHKDRPFYEKMCQRISSGPVVVLVLEKEDAVAAFRELLGATDPAQAAPGTLRHQFGMSIEANAVHGSDAEATAFEEINFFFPT